MPEVEFRLSASTTFKVSLVGLICRYNFSALFELPPEDVWVHAAAIITTPFTPQAYPFDLVDMEYAVIGWCHWTIHVYFLVKF